MSFPMRPPVLRALAALPLAAAALAPAAHAQKLAKYGADFLSGGVGGQALGMGAAVALTNDVAASYWNPAGLTSLTYPQIGALHAERFAGVVSFDYAGAAMPLSARSTLGLAVFRSGVNDIKNTLNAWDPERDQPKDNYDAYLSTFSAADWAFFASYARELNGPLRVGVTAKAIRRTIGDFADAWGFSFDVGAQYRVGRVRLGANLQDVAGQYQTWSVNPEAFNTNEQTNPQTGEAYTFAETFGQDLPSGGTYVVPPVARLGMGYDLPLGGGASVTLGADLDMAFEGREAYAFNAGSVSFSPRIGTELAYKGVVAFRAGLGRIEPGADGGVAMSPVLGAGLTLKQVQIDYGFGDFAGVTQELGQTHRITARLTLEQPRLARKSD